MESGRHLVMEILLGLWLVMEFDRYRLVNLKGIWLGSLLVMMSVFGYLVKSTALVLLQRVIEMVLPRFQKMDAVSMLMSILDLLLVI